MNTELPEETIEGVTLKFQVDTARGDFLIYFEGEWWRSDSLKKLREKIRAYLRQQGVAIPATLIDGVDDDRLQVTRITITGQHAGNHNWLYTIPKTGERSQHRWGTLYREMTGAEIQELVRKYRAAKKAKEELRDYINSFELAVHDAYEAARDSQRQPAEKA